MAGWRRTLWVALACALMLAVPSVAMAAAPVNASVAGTWSGHDAYSTMVLTLYDDGYYETTIEQDGQEYDQYGYYSMDATTMYFTPDNGAMSAFGYWYSGNILTLTDWQTGETLTLTRQQENTSAIPEGLVGVWAGPDGDDYLTLSLSADATYSMEHRNNPGVTSGVFSVGDDVLTLSPNEGSSIELKYLLTGDTLILAVEGTDLTSTLHRLLPGAPTPAPAVTAIPEPVSTAAPEPVLTVAPEPIPTVVPEPISTAAPEPVPTAAQEPAATAPVPPPGLTGAWQGSGAEGSIAISLLPDGRIEIVQAGSTRTGSYASDASTIRASFQDGTAQVYRYILMGDTLLLTDEQLGNPVTLTRIAQPARQLDPALFGTWGGLDKGEYGELTLTNEGAVTVFVPSNPDTPLTGTYTASGGAIAFNLNGKSVEGTYTVGGDSFKLTREGATAEYSRKSGPLTRGAAVQEPVASTVDAALAGTWGGVENGVYVEFTFSGGGGFSRFAPGDEARSASGTFMAGAGNLAVLLPDGALQGTYVLAGDNLTLTWSGSEAAAFIRQAGPLSRATDGG